MYIKLFEEINFNSNKVNYKKYVDKSTLYIYDFILDNLEFRVQFLNVSGDLNNQNTWVRSYSSKKSSGKYNYELVNKKPIEILSSIQYITEIFIKEVNPNCVIIEHINNKDEDIKKGEMNKRSRVNYNFIKKIPNYNLKYMSLLDPILHEYDDTSYGTVAVLSKDGFDDIKKGKYKNCFDL